MSRILCLLLLTMSALSNSALAHPGHSMLEHGPAHVLGSSYHLAIAFIGAFLSFLVGAVASNAVVRRTLNGFGVAALVAAVVLVLRS